MCFQKNVVNEVPLYWRHELCMIEKQNILTMQAPFMMGTDSEGIRFFCKKVVKNYWLTSCMYYVFVFKMIIERKLTIISIMTAKNFPMILITINLLNQDLKT